MKHLIACCLAAGLLALSGAAFAQDLEPFPVDRVRPTPEGDLITNARLTTTSYGFLKLTNHPRSAALGDAYSAVGNDLSAVFYNPAGITQMETDREVVAGYSSWIAGSNLSTFALGMKSRFATVAVSAVYFGTEEFLERTSFNPTGTGRMVKGTDMALGLTIAKQLTDKLSFGFQFRWIQEDLDLMKYSTVDVNFGTIFYTGYRSTRLSMTLRNLGADKEVIAQKARVPTVFNLAGAMEVFGNLGDPVSVTVSFEQMFYTDYAARYYFGAEAWISNMLAIRAGYKTRHDSESWTIGAGYKGKLGNQVVKLDASYSNAAAFEEHPLRLSLGFGF